MRLESSAHKAMMTLTTKYKDGYFCKDIDIPAIVKGW